jgi:hypothetical protein
MWFALVAGCLGLLLAASAAAAQDWSRKARVYEVVVSAAGA